VTAKNKFQIIQFNSILIYLHDNLTAQGQLQSEHELGYRNKRTQIKSQCEQVSNNNNNINNNINSNNGIDNNNDNNNSLTNSVKHVFQQQGFWSKNVYVPTNNISS
jgi:hypothetical protein